MPAILTHQAIMLLARDRVTDLRDRLVLKKAKGLVLTDLELRVLRLATFTHIAMSEGDDTHETVETPSEADWPDGFGKNVSRFSVMGSMGPDIPGLAALLAPAQELWFDTVHKGTPDANREKVNARTTDLALAIWEQGTRALSNRPAQGADAEKARDRARDQLRAYVLGHLCHIVGDTIAHPFVHDVEWHVPPGERASTLAGRRSTETSKVSHAKTEASLDTRVAIETFRRAGPRDGQAWSAWWPDVADVPPELFEAYEKAFAEIYRRPFDRPSGLAEFEKALGGVTPPEPDADFFRDGYRALHNAGLGILYEWSYARWLGFLAVALVPAIAAFPLTFALPRGKHVFDDGGGDERAVFEALTLPLAINSIWPIVYGATIAGVTTRGSSTISTLGLLGSGISALAGLLYFATLLSGVDPGKGFRWGVCFGVPAVLGFAFAVSALVEGLRGESRRKSVLLLYAAPFLIAAVSGGLLLFFTRVVGGEIGFGVLSGIVGVVGLVLLFVLPKKLRDAKLPEDALAFPALRPHTVRLFDRSALLSLPSQSTMPIDMPADHYPTGVRPLLKLWWEGSGDLFVRPRRTHLEYVFAQDGSAPNVVPAPITPMTQQQLAAYLTNAVRDAAKQNGKLKCALLVADDDVELEPGALFADHGDVDESRDDDTTDAALAVAAAQFKQLGTTNDDDAYVLYHAPKRAQAVRFDRFGPEPFDDREDEAADGPGTISGSGTTITGVATAFRFFFQPGDRIVFNGQARVVTKVNGDLSLVVSSPFKPAPNGDHYQRLGTDAERSRGYAFVAQPRRRSGTGETIMDAAGDVAALLCLGGTSQMLDVADLAVPDLDGQVAADGTPLGTTTLAGAKQVFRNWCLDRRLVDEWRELVVGGATPGADAASATDAGARTLLQQGWVQTLRKWMRVVDVHDQSAVDATRRDGGGTTDREPSNLELSQAIAFVLDMPAPVAVVRGSAG